jgi:DNA-binding GntR family transcriptional regulator
VTPSVYEQLHERIITGELGPGVRLTESDLASTFGISRTPVREALRRLEQDGLVERAARGMHVRMRTPSEILEIYEVRIVLETAAARAAAEKATELELARLRQLHELMAASSPDDATLMMKGNRRFHEQVWTMSHNASLVDLLNRLNSLILRYGGTTLTHQNRWATALAEHAEMIDAIEAGDCERAGLVAGSHMTAARDTRLKMYAESAVRDV